MFLVKVIVLSLGLPEVVFLVLLEHQRKQPPVPAWSLLAVISVFLSRTKTDGVHLFRYVAVSTMSTR